MTNYSNAESRHSFSEEESVPLCLFQFHNYTRPLKIGRTSPKIVILASLRLVRVFRKNEEGDREAAPLPTLQSIALFPEATFASLATHLILRLRNVVGLGRSLRGEVAYPAPPTGCPVSSVPKAKLPMVSTLTTPQD